MKQEFVTLPRAVVEQAIAALTDLAGWRAAPLCDLLRAALEQPQNHVPDAGNMVPAGWKLVPVEPTCGMVLAGEHSMKQHDFFRLDAGYRAMLAAAPQHPTTEQSSAVEQPQDEQEPVAWIEPGGNRVGLNFDYEYTITEEHPRDLGWLPLYTRPQPKREPLSLAQIAEVFGWKPGYLPTPEQVHDARAIEAAHNIK